MREALFVGRETEKELAWAAANEVSLAPNAAQRAIHIHGPEAVGKTALIKELRSSLSGERLSVVSLSFADPYALDPFTQLIRLRNALKSRVDGFDCDAFDAAALLFDCTYRDGSLTHAQLRDGGFAADKLLEEGFKEAVGEGGKGWIAAALGAGVGATAAKAAGLAGLLSQALAAGATGIAGLGACLLLKGLLKRIAKRLKEKRLLGANPELKRLMMPDGADYDTFEQVLPLLLARAVCRHKPGSFGYVPCVLLDPADGLGGSDGTHGLVGVGRWLARVFDALEKKILIVTSRDETRTWGSQARSRGSLPALPLTSCPLGPLSLADVRAWLDVNGLGEIALPGRILTVDGTAARPKEFAEWATWLLTGANGSASRHAEDETV